MYKSTSYQCSSYDDTGIVKYEGDLNLEPMRHKRYVYNISFGNF